MATLLTITEGWTQELGPFTLEIDDVAVDLTGWTVALILREKNGTQVASPDTRVDNDPTTGDVYWTPDGTEAAAESPYSLHWQVTDGDGKVVYFPNTMADKVIVVKE
mgnify:CR=1 FL=1